MQTAYSTRFFLLAVAVAVTSTVATGCGTRRPIFGEPGDDDGGGGGRDGGATGDVDAAIDAAAHDDDDASIELGADAGGAAGDDAGVSDAGASDPSTSDAGMSDPGTSDAGAPADAGHAADAGSVPGVDAGSPAGMDAGFAIDAGGPGMCVGASRPEGTFAACTNACDDDHDGFIDCVDFDCAGVGSCPRRDAGVRVDAGTAISCVGAPEAEGTIATCNNGCDDDRDGYADCADFGCAGIAPCTADGGIVTCAGAVVPENTLATCTDGCSNDGDRYVDCADFDCAGIGSCPTRDAGTSP